MKRKLKSKTTIWRYEDKTVIHTKVMPEQQIVYFSGTDKPFEWGSNGGYIDLDAPKPKFITRFKDRIKKMNPLTKLIQRRKR